MAPTLLQAGIAANILAMYINHIVYIELETHKGDNTANEQRRTDDEEIVDNEIIEITYFYTKIILNVTYTSFVG